MIRYLNLPSIPKEIINNLNYEFDRYDTTVSYLDKTYVWSDDFNQEISLWCKKNICNTMHWGFQIINGDLPIHKDVGTTLKLIYLIRSGGSEVKTNFFQDDETTLTHSYVIPVEQWHILKADDFHSVSGVHTGQTRFSLTGRIFPL